ncbi:CDP-6-deoxy-delta-3,4-glucoseen reductase [Solemya velesiana gill symbiont]|uniref:CDP-6-deoxy-delta-3,4-glucoseen reductase n=1 Tax=Solemya velesiana gill symbiont TaxID=1918948 RepID=A0A1T2KUT3_9GAMM|nr:CDP-6-deoxy-delta-3,4-glucoseen reductase [Solemya velesiana gill symbiont]OOZ36582.1 CDP-6-deoxy-delta-3,4-glucoseen reductase [Solemya velesiana gill symbiont]
MSFTVHVTPSGHQFSTEEGETILDAAERQGIVMPYGCRNGLCGSCAGTLEQGAVSYPGEEESDLAIGGENQCLTCKAVASSDITIHIKEVESTKEIEVRTLPSKVDEMEQLAHDVMRVYLKLLENQRLQFLAGQYLDFLMEDGRRRAFSIANAPHDDERIELHIRRVPGGEFTDYVFDTMKSGSIERIQAPLGGFYLREDSDRPLIMMAGGTGFAPLKGIIEHAFHIGIDRPIHLYWGVRAEQDLYLAELAEKWAAERENFQFTPVLSEPDEGWTGATGWVHEAVVADYPDMSAYDLYMSGPPPMVFAGKDAFLAVGLPEDNMYSDVFEWAKDNPNK